jgi:hypothetical protein
MCTNYSINREKTAKEKSKLVGRMFISYSLNLVFSSCLNLIGPGSCLSHHIRRRQEARKIAQAIKILSKKKKKVKKKEMKQY